MKILKIYPKIDTKKRYNYNVNYGLWDQIEGDKVILENFNKNLNNYDVVFLPMYKRWENNKNLFNRIKEHRIKTVLFDNDSVYRSFNDKFYHNIDFCFYRGVDKFKNKPKCNSFKLKWSVNTEILKPKYGCEKITFNCTVNKHYPLRQNIAKIIKSTNFFVEKYIDNIKNSGAAIHTDSEIAPVVRAKAIEFAACGTEIISNKVDNMNDYYPDELITYFNDINHLKEIIKNYKPNIEIQKELRHITEIKHDVRIRSKEVIHEIKKLF